MGGCVYNAPFRIRSVYMLNRKIVGRIYVGKTINPANSKIEASYIGSPDVDVSYVDGYSVPITCSSQGVVVSGCNIPLFNAGNPCSDMDNSTCNASYL